MDRIIASDAIDPSAILGGCTKKTERRLSFGLFVKPVGKSNSSDPEKKAFRNLQYQAQSKKTFLRIDLAPKMLYNYMVRTKRGRKYGRAEVEL